MEINIQDYLIFKNEILNFINLYINETQILDNLTKKYHIESSKNNNDHKFLLKQFNKRSYNYRPIIINTINRRLNENMCSWQILSRWLQYYFIIFFIMIQNSYRGNRPDKNEIKQFFINGPKDPYAIFDVFDKKIKYSLNYQNLGYDIIFSKICEGNYQNMSHFVQFPVSDKNKIQVLIILMKLIWSKSVCYYEAQTELYKRFKIEDEIKIDDISILKNRNEDLKFLSNLNYF